MRALFQTSDPAAANFISAEYQAGKLVPGQSPGTVQSLSVRFDQKGHERPFQKAVIVDVVDGYLNAGDHIIVRLGDRRGGGPGTRVQTFTEDRFRFRCYVDPLGTSRFVPVPGDLVIDMAPGAPARLLVNGPRFARPGERLPFRFSLQDRWGNACKAAGGTILLRAFSGAELVYEKEHALPQQGWARRTTVSARRWGMSTRGWRSSSVPRPGNEPIARSNCSTPGRAATSR